jgi:hypothetical protein
MKNYDYWLIIWKDCDGYEVHEPACFETGIHPEEWCRIVLDRTNNTRNDRSPRYKSFELYKLIKGEKA